MFITLTKVSDIFQSDPQPIRINTHSISSMIDLPYGRNLKTGARITVEALGEVLVLETPDQVERLIKEAQS